MPVCPETSQSERQASQDLCNRAILLQKELDTANGWQNHAVDSQKALDKTEGEMVLGFGFWV